MTAEADNIRQLGPLQREVLFKLIEFEHQAPLGPTKLVQEIPEDGDLDELSVEFHLSALQEVGLADSVRRDDPDGTGLDPIAYRPSPGVRQAARELLRTRLEQIVRPQHEGWSQILKQRKDASDRVVEGAFCPRCGSVYAGDGICDECERDVEGDLVADGGRSL